MTVQSQRIIRVLPARAARRPRSALYLLLLWALTAALLGFALMGSLVSSGFPSERAAALYPALLQDECGDGSCDGSEDSDSCPEDCGGGEEDPYCGDSSCDPGEDSSWCPEDCGSADLYCGDGACNGNEDSSWCPEDCEAGGAVCGDGTCDGGSGEDEENCSEDCGGGGSVCGDGYCDWDGGEDPSSCSEDCYEAICGDGYCDPDYEDSGSCVEDCGEYESYCGDDYCDAASGEDADWCPDDCGDYEAVCGDSFCDYDYGEDKDTCADDCAGDAVCGDGYCDEDAGEDSDVCAYDCGYSSCGDGFCDENIEDEEICPDDCATGYEPICGDDYCDADAGEDPDSCAYDCSNEYEADCGDAFCDPGEEDAASCAEDCGDLIGPEGGTVTSEPGLTSTTDASAGESPDEALLAATEEAEILTEYTATDLPENCELMPYEELDDEILDAMDTYSDSLAIIGKMVLVCEREARDVCVPYRGDAAEPDQVQIVSCDDAGVCHVYRAVSIRKMGKGAAVCISARFGRPMPTCTGACAAASGLAITETDVSGYVLPFAMLMGIITVSGVGGVFMISRKRNRESDGEIETFDTGVVTKARRAKPAILPVTTRKEDDSDEADTPETMRLEMTDADVPTQAGGSSHNADRDDDDDTQVDDSTIRLDRP